MKTITIIGIVIFVVLITGCKDDNTKLLDSVSGTWEVNKITYKNTNTRLDSTINCTNCVLQLDNCTLGNGGCGGYYKLMDGQKVNIMNSPSGKAQELSLSVVGEPANPVYQLVGIYEIKSLSGSAMILIGTLKYKMNNSFRLFDVEIALKK
jgi:hypothetical protein